MKKILFIAIGLLFLNGFMDCITFVIDFKNRQFNYAISGFNFNESAVYEKNGTIVHLVGMTHIANREFYENLKYHFYNKKAITLGEGVSDKKNQLQGFNYKALAKILNLDTQPKSELIFPNVVITDMDAKDLDQSEMEILRYNFLMLNEIVSVIDYPDNAPKKIIKIKDFKKIEIETSSILNMRTKYVLQQMDDKIKLGEKEIIIPWGALHLKDIESHLLTRGFKRVDGSFYYTGNTFVSIGSALINAGKVFFKSNVVIVDERN